ncbi:hypothetical protein CWC28_21795, partial [Pseudoalteromonas sp. S4492]
PDTGSVAQRVRQRQRLALVDRGLEIEGELGAVIELIVEQACAVQCQPQRRRQRQCDGDGQHGQQAGDGRDQQAACAVARNGSVMTQPAAVAALDRDTTGARTLARRT